MKPVDFYNIKPENIQIWHDGLNSKTFSDILGIEEFDLDYQKAETDTSDKFVVHTKASRNIDGERSVSMEAYYYDGKPFAFSIESGRGGNENSNAFITDPVIQQQAIEYVKNYLEVKNDFDIIDPEQDIDVFDSEYGYTLFFDKIAENFKLVSGYQCAIPNHNNVPEDEQYKLYVLDEEEQRKNFEDSIRPLADKWFKKNKDNFYNQKNCLYDDDIRQAYCESILKTLRVPDEDKCIVNRQSIPFKLDEPLYRDFISVAFRMYDQCFIVSAYKDGMGLSWANKDVIYCIGESELYDKIKALSPEPFIYKDKNKGIVIS